jgi:DNA-binding MarR family transcriptional regulator
MAKKHLADVKGLVEPWRRNNIGRSLFNAAHQFESDMLNHLAAAGFGEVRRAHLNLFRYLKTDGSRLTDLADSAGMTKQGMQDLVDKVEAIGLVERLADEDDLRAKKVCLTARGVSFLGALRKAVRHAERRFLSSVGSSGAERTQVALAAYIAAGMDGA